MDPVLLSRIQFAVTVGFHFLFPPITIGLAWLLVVMEWRGWRRNDVRMESMARFFSKILALTFAVGVATGIVMEFQFGTNWAGYSRFVGDVFGAPLAAEAVFAFFLESGFLGLYLFGRGRVSKRAHWFSISMVAVGSTVSAFWIIVANSWQQTPAGHVVRNGRAELASFVEAVFNPSTAVRFTHTLVASLAAGAFVVMGVSAFLVLRDRDAHGPRSTLRLGLCVGLAASLLLLFPTGHEHARQVARTQPEKFAAIEGLYKSQTAAPLVIFGIPSENPPEIKAAIQIPGLLSWLVFGDVNARIRGIEEFPPDQIPPLALTFASFHLMVALGLAMILLAALGVWMVWRKKIEGRAWYLRTLVWCIPVPLVACQIGWITAEVGRQPWIVYKLMRTRDAVSVSVPAEQILVSLLLFSLVYLLLGSLYVFLLVKKVKRGPEPISQNL